VQDESGVHIVSLDANFGLVRKKSAGKSLAPPNHTSLYFLPQSDIDKRLDGLPKGIASEKTKVSYDDVKNVVFLTLKYVNVQSFVIITIHHRHHHRFSVGFSILALPLHLVLSCEVQRLQVSLDTFTPYVFLLLLLPFGPAPQSLCKWIPNCLCFSFDMSKRPQSTMPHSNFICPTSLCIKYLNTWY